MWLKGLVIQWQIIYTYWSWDCQRNQLSSVKFSSGGESVKSKFLVAVTSFFFFVILANKYWWEGKRYYSFLSIWHISKTVSQFNVITFS